MDDAVQADAYARADFAASNALFCERLVRHALPEDARVLDLGCGPADIPARLAAAYPRFRLYAVDGAAAMLSLAGERLAAEGLAGRVALVHGSLGSLELPQGFFDVVLSNSLLHHLHDPSVLWREVALRGRSGALVQVMDLRRPPDEAAARTLVETHAADEPSILRRDFLASLRAAFTPEEVACQLRQAGLHFEIEQVGDRHLLVTGRLPQLAPG